MLLSRFASICHGSDTVESVLGPFAFSANADEESEDPLGGKTGG